MAGLVWSLATAVSAIGMLLAACQPTAVLHPPVTARRPSWRLPRALPQLNTATTAAAATTPADATNGVGENATAGGSGTPQLQVRRAGAPHVFVCTLASHGSHCRLPVVVPVLWRCAAKTESTPRAQLCPHTARSIDVDRSRSIGRARVLERASTSCAFHI